jgi:hypothetical protein
MVHNLALSFSNFIKSIFLLTLLKIHFMYIKQTVNQYFRNIIMTLFINRSFLQQLMYRLMLISIVFLFTFPLNAAIYYVSATGNDANPGTSTSAPWRTLSKVNSFTPKPGDQILFKRGDTWYGTITVKASGTSASPITYGAWGTGANPVISGFTTVTGWTNEGGGIYSKPLTVESNPDIVTINGYNMQWEEPQIQTGIIHNILIIIILIPFQALLKLPIVNVMHL